MNVKYFTSNAANYRHKENQIITKPIDDSFRYRQVDTIEIVLKKWHLNGGKLLNVRGPLKNKMIRFWLRDPVQVEICLAT